MPVDITNTVNVIVTLPVLVGLFVWLVRSVFIDFFKGKPKWVSMILVSVAGMIAGGVYAFLYLGANDVREIGQSCIQGLAIAGESSLGWNAIKAITPKAKFVTKFK